MQKTQNTQTWQDRLSVRLGDSGRGQWFRVGLLSATALAPLIARWNALRADERAQAVRDEAETRLRDLGAWAARFNLDDVNKQATQALRAVSEGTPARRNTRTILWLTGVGVGLVAAGVGAYVIAQRRLRSDAEGPLVELPQPTLQSNGHNTYARDLVGTLSRQPATPTQEQTAAQSSTGSAASPAAAPRPGAHEPVVREPEAQTGGGATQTETGAPAGVTNTAQAAFIGNIRTLIYHEAQADPDLLPGEENRIYFASEQEAREAGFRRAHDEVPPEQAGAQTNESGA